MELEAVKRRQARCGRKSSIDEGRQKWQVQERERRQSELSEELVEQPSSDEDDEESDDEGGLSSGSDSDSEDELGGDTVQEMHRLSTVAERKTMELTAGHSSGMAIGMMQGTGGTTTGSLGYTKEMQSGPLTRAGSVALSSGGFSLTSRSSDSDGGSSSASGGGGGSNGEEGTGALAGATSPLAFTQDNVADDNGGSGGVSRSTSSASTCSNSSSGGSSSGGDSGGTGLGSTAGSGSLQVWMGLPKSPRPYGAGGANGRGGGAKSYAKLQTTTLSPAQESEEIYDGCDCEEQDGPSSAAKASSGSGCGSGSGGGVGEGSSASGMDEDDDDEEEEEDESCSEMGESEDWSDLEEEEYVGGGGSGGGGGGTIRSTMSKFDQLEATWRQQLRSSGFHG